MTRNGWTWEAMQILAGTMHALGLDCGECEFTDASCRKCGGRLRVLTLGHYDEHPGMCCDCFDEEFGMAEKQRLIPRGLP